jgi:hypothetical protein
MRKLVLPLLIFAFVSPASAQGADPAEKESLESYQKGVTAYDLGKFDEAVQAFQKAYEIKPTPAYLYNIAQAYRQKGDASKAVFFYKRYLQKAPDAKNRDVVERRIAELEELAKKQEESKTKPPNSLDGEKGTESPPPEPPPAPRTVVAQAPPAGEETSPSPETTVSSAATPGPSVARLALEAGTAFVSLGDGPDVPVQLSIRAGGAYTLHFGSLALDLGAAGTLVPVPFETLDRASTGTAMLIGLLANAGVRAPVASGLELRGELGAGVVLMSGLVAGNPFTEGGAESGMLAMPHVRVAGGLDYAVAQDLMLTLTPAFGWSAAAADLDSKISSIIRFDVLLGVAYTL